MVTLSRKHPCIFNSFYRLHPRVETSWHLPKRLVGDIVKSRTIQTIKAYIWSKSPVTTSSRAKVYRWLRRGKHVGKESYKDRRRNLKQARSQLKLKYAFSQGVNGYPYKHKRLKFFRAKKPDELWQIDFKGPFIVQGKKFWFLVYIDDYSRFLVLAEQFNHDPKTREVMSC